MAELHLPAVLPPLFPLLKDVFDVSYQQLGLLTMAFYAVSGMAQPASGFLVDDAAHGAHRYDRARTGRHAAR